MSSANRPPDTVRVGILGAGSVAELYHLPVLRNIPHVHISWICDRVLDRAHYLAKMYSVPVAQAKIDGCGDVDIVLVAIPLGHRRESLRVVFQRGWNALCEKPFAASTADHEAILAEASAGGVQVGVGLMRRFYCGTMLARRIVQGQVFGPVEQIWASEGYRMRGTGRPENWYQGDSKMSGGGILSDFGIHLLDQVMSIFGAEDFSVDEGVQCSHEGIEVETRVKARISTLHRESAPLSFAVSYINDLHSAIVMGFPRLNLHLGLLPGDFPVLTTKDGQQLARLEAEIGAREIFQAFYLEWEAFIRQCISGQPSEIDAKSARVSTAFVESCYRVSRPENAGWRDGRAEP